MSEKLKGLIEATEIAIQIYYDPDNWLDGLKAALAEYKVEQEEIDANKSADACRIKPEKESEE